MPLVTVIIATFNSDKVLKRTLEALEMQTYKNIETLILDGGSTDATVEIAHIYNCKVINNPKTDPVSAKLLGLNSASGKYAVFIDHDEVMINHDVINIQIHALLKHPECKAALCSGYKRPNNYPKLNQYISEFGDPFSLFVYHFSKDFHFFEHLLNKNY